MLISHEHDKLIEAIKFFVSNTKYCGTIKLFKLLYWLDYHHFRETGRTTTGLKYYALPRGPVPTALYDQFKSKKGDVVSHFDIEDHHQAEDPRQVPTIDDGDPSRLSTGRKKFVPTQIKPKTKFAHRFLTVREMRIAQQLADIFNEATADQITDIAHIRGGPWQKALKIGGPNSEIDFLSALVPMQKGDYLDENELRERVQEYADLKRSLA